MRTESFLASGSEARRDWLVPFIAVVCTLIVAGSAAHPYPIGVFHDDGVYALLGRSIARGHGFVHDHLPGSPAAIHYPPLYPLLLAVVWRLRPDFPANTPALMLMNVLLIGIGAGGCAWYLQRWLHWRPWLAVITAVAVCATLPMLTFASALLAEPLCLALLWPALVLSERASTGGAGTRRLMLAGALVGVVMLVRTQMLALALALWIVLALRWRWRDTAVCAGATLAILLPWMLWSAGAAPRVSTPLAGAYGSYLGWYVIGLREGGVPFVLSTVLENSRESWLLLRDRVATGPGWLTALAAGMALLLLARGLWVARRSSPVLALFVPLYLGITVLWPYAPWRFVWGVWPVLLVVAVLGVPMESREPAITSHLWRLAAVLPLLLMVLTEFTAWRQHAWRAPAARARASIAPLIAWVRANTPPDAVVLAEAEPLVSLFTGRRAAPPTTFTALEYRRARAPADEVHALSSMIAAVHPGYLVTISPAVQSAAASIIASHGPLSLIAAGDGLSAYRVSAP